MVLAAALSFVVIVFHLTLNELVEVDKIGPVFFICLALLIRAQSWLDAEPENPPASGLSPNTPPPL